MKRNKPYNLRNFQEFLTEKKELCTVVLRHFVIGLHNYGLLPENIKGTLMQI